jgi:hypothetical protein
MCCQSFCLHSYTVDGNANTVFTSTYSQEVMVLVPLSAGSHSLVWNLHQEPDLGQAVATLSNFIITGSSTGGAQLLPCPAGTYSTQNGSIACSPCPPGTYMASNSPSLTCVPCPVNSYSNMNASISCDACASGTFTEQPGATFCETDCTFNNGTWNLEPLWGTVGPISDFQHDSFYINICDIQLEGNCPATHVCLVDSNENGYDSGNFLSYQVITGTHQHLLFSTTRTLVIFGHSFLLQHRLLDSHSPFSSATVTIKDA